MSVSITQPEITVVITQITDEDLLSFNTPDQAVNITQFDGPEVAVQFSTGALVAITPIPDPEPTILNITKGGPADAIVVLDYSTGPKGDTGAAGGGGGGGGTTRVNTDITAAWADVFHVQDEDATDEWTITRIDEVGDATSADYIGNPLLTTAAAWTQRLSLVYS